MVYIAGMDNSRKKPKKGCINEYFGIVGWSS